MQSCRSSKNKPKKNTFLAIVLFQLGASGYSTQKLKLSASAPYIERMEYGYKKAKLFSINN
jgi:hypothetical protein